MAGGNLGITGIDHTLIGVRDLESAKGTWSRLGFTPTPRGRHIGWGTGNYCIMLEQGYIELLGIVDPSKFTNNLDKFLERHEGLLGLAFSTDDAAQCHAALSEAGLQPDGPKDLKRLLESPEGPVLPEFSLIFLPPEKTPELSAFICCHLTPDLIRRPEWLAHANGAERLVSTTIVCADPVSTAFTYLSIFGDEHIKVANHLTTIICGRGAIRFVDPRGLQSLFPELSIEAPTALPWMASMKIEVDSLAKCSEHLRSQGLSPIIRNKTCLLQADAANGVILEFVEG